jgi:hypothetical protein
LRAGAALVERLVPAATDNSVDVHERSSGSTKLTSTP